MSGRESDPPTERRRPYWHVDAKWISGLLSLAALSATLLALALFQVTAERTAVPVAAEALAAFISPPGQGAEANVLAALEERIEASAEGVFYPFPGVDVGVTAEDLETASPDELRARLFTGLAEEIYWTGLDSLPGSAEEDTWSRIGFMALLTHNTHTWARRALLVSGGLSLLFLALLALFSFRAGRLASPGCALTLAGLPGLLLFGALMGAVNGPEAASAAQFAAGRLTAAAAALKPALEAVLRTYMWATAAGLLLLVAGLIAAILGRLRGASPSP